MCIGADKRSCALGPMMNVLIGILGYSVGDILTAQGGVRGVKSQNIETGTHGRRMDRAKQLVKIHFY